MASAVTFAQYNACAGKSEIREERVVKTVDQATGKHIVDTVYVRPTETDVHGNLKGNEYDLAVDGAFEGQTILVVNICGNTMDLARAAVKEKGFNMVVLNTFPEIAQFTEYLQKSCQFWILSGGSNNKVGEDYLKLIEAYFNSGRGVYIWNDNTPYHNEGNQITNYLMGVTMTGEYWGDQVLGFKTEQSQNGLVANHLITTGLETVYEGITISTIHDPNQNLEPIFYSSDGNVVAAVYDQKGKRLIVDGGFTRLCVKWDAAGTSRYVKNAAAWLANVERFGTEVSVVK
jgi:hypothetical protein